MLDDGERIKRYKARLETLRNERESFLSSWRDISEHIYPWALRTFLCERNRDTKATKNFVNSYPAWCAEILSAGMHSGITSPSRPWFKLSLHERERGDGRAKLSDRHDIKIWLHEVEVELQRMLHQSNAYTALPTIYQSLVLFGTAALFVSEDPVDGVRFFPIPNGAFFLTGSSKLSVDTFYREFSMTVAQLVEEFGLENVSQEVRHQHNRGEFDTWVEVVHAIEPNNPNRRALAAKDTKPFIGVFFEKTADGNFQGFLRETGYDEFPVMAPRWSIVGEDIYGRGPGHRALGDARDLQNNAMKQLVMLDRFANPPLFVPTSLVGRMTMTPGAVNQYNPTTGEPKIGPVYLPSPSVIDALATREQQIQQRIDHIFFVDIFLAFISQPADGRMTATEVVQRQQEKMLVLGPVLERLNDDLLSPLIKRVFSIALRQGRIPPLPSSVSMADLKIDYLSILALAQRSSDITSIERFLMFVGSVAGVQPTVTDLVDFDELAKTMCDLLGVPPDSLVTQETVDKIRNDRAESMAAMQQMQAVRDGIEGAKLLSETDTGGANALTSLARGFG